MIRYILITVSIIIFYLIFIMNEVKSEYIVDKNVSVVKENIYYQKEFLEKDSIPEVYLEEIVVYSDYIISNENQMREYIISELDLLYPLTKCPEKDSIVDDNLFKFIIGTDKLIVKLYLDYYMAKNKVTSFCSEKTNEDLGSLGSDELFNELYEKVSFTNDTSRDDYDYDAYYTNKIESLWNE